MTSEEAYRRIGLLRAKAVSTTFDAERAACLAKAAELELEFGAPAPEAPTKEPKVRVFQEGEEAAVPTWLADAVENYLRDLQDPNRTVRVFVRSSWTQADARPREGGTR